MFIGVSVITNLKTQASSPKRKKSTYDRFTTVPARAFWAATDAASCASHLTFKASSSCSTLANRKSGNKVPVEPEQQHLLCLVSQSSGAHITKDLLEGRKVPLSLTTSVIDACTQLCKQPDVRSAGRQYNLPRRGYPIRAPRFPVLEEVELGVVLGDRFLHVCGHLTSFQSSGASTSPAGRATFLLMSALILSILDVAGGAPVSALVPPNPPPCLWRLSLLLGGLPRLGHLRCYRCRRSPR